uniref:Glycoprotein n=1 Tax=Strongyloides stercoralis TaxID=6248 RepID=A0A0K0DXV7_STRER
MFFIINFKFLLIVSLILKTALFIPTKKNFYQICSENNPIDSIQIPIPFNCSSLEFEKIYFTKTTIIKVLSNGICQSYVMPVYFNKKFIYIQGLSYPFFKRVTNFSKKENICIPKTSEPIGGDYFIRDPDQLIHSIEYECSVCYYYFIKKECELSNEFAFKVLKIIKESKLEDNIGRKLARLLTQRNTVTGKVSGLSLQIMECNLYKPDKIYSNKVIGNICYKEVPIKIGEIIYFTKNNLDLLITGTKISCYTSYFTSIWIFILSFILFLILVPFIYHLMGMISNFCIFLQINVIRHIYNFEIYCWFTLVWYELKIQLKLNFKKGWCGLGSILSLICCTKIENLEAFEIECLTNAAINTILEDKINKLNVILEKKMLERNKELFTSTNSTLISDESIIYDF